MDFFKKASASLQEGNSSDLLKQAQGFLGEEKTPETTTTTPPVAAPVAPGEAPAAAPEAGGGGYSEVFSSAQTLYQGIQDKVSGKTDIDNQQLAGAANDVLKAAETSGLLKDSQYKDYFSKAEGYLSSYATKGAATEQEPTTAPTSAPPTAPTSEPPTAPQDQD